MHLLRRTLFSLGLVAVLCVATRVARAADHVVTSTGDSGAGSLRAAITAATGGDTISFAVTGTITLAGQLNLDKNVMDKDISSFLQQVAASNPAASRRMSAALNHPQEAQLQ